MLERISYTMGLMRSSWDVLKKDKELLFFPLLSSICCLLVLASFALPLWGTGYWQPPAQDASLGTEIGYYSVLFAFYFVNYFVVVFFNSAIIACAVKRMQGGDPTVRDGLRAAAARWHLIVGWALISATVSTVLRIIEDRSSWVASIVAGLLGMAWSVVTFLAVPVMVVEQTGPVDTFKRSASLLRDTWGQQIVGRFGFGLVFTLLALPGIIPVAVGGIAGGMVGAIIGGAITLIYLLALGLVQSVLHAVFQAAVYLYAREGQAPVEFGTSMLNQAMGPRQQRGLTG